MLIWALGQLAVAQPGQNQIFGNEWINYTQPHWKIPIDNEGIYRISYQQLLNAGVPVNTADPRRLQLFFRGKEMAITVVGQADGRFDPQDYVEFYGRRNSGDLARALFAEPNNYTLPNFGLYEFFRAYYFLTINANENALGKRIGILTGTDASLRPEINHTQQVDDTERNNSYLALGQLYPTSFVTNADLGALLSSYNEGKGPVKANRRPSPQIILRDFALEDVLTSPASPARLRLLMRVAGRINTPHSVDLFAGMALDSMRRPIGGAQFNNYRTVDIEATPDSVVLPRRNGNFFAGYRVNQVLGGNEDLCLAFVRIFYPQGFDLQGSGLRKFWLNQVPSGRSRVVIANAASGVRLFDLTDEWNIRAINPVASGNNLDFTVDQTTVQRNLLADNRVNSVGQILPVTFRRLPVQSSDYLIVTHPFVARPVGQVPNAAQAYADYRASEAGGNYKPLLVDVNDLYDQFSDGEPNPLAIRRFAAFALAQGRPKFLFILGKGLQMQINHFMNGPSLATWANIPPWGGPASDHELTAGLNGFPDHVPALATGRLAANNPQQVLDYLAKVREYESMEYNAAALWKKNILHLSGGLNVNENRDFRRYMEGFAEVARGNFLGAKVETISKRTTENVEFLNVTDQINRGVNLITFYGHAALDFTDIDIGRASDPRLNFNNKGRYPMMLINGCGSGDAFRQTISLGEDWILAPNKGAILFLAHSHLGLTGPLRAYTQTFYDNAFAKRELINQPIGIIMQTFLRDYLSRFPGEVNVANVQQFLLQGDPAIQLFKLNKPDYSVSSNTLFLQSFTERSTITAQADSFRIAIPVTNLGLTSPTPLTVSVRRTFSDFSTEFLPIRTYPPVNYQDTIYFTIVNPRNAQDRIAGNNIFEVTVDATNQIDEANENNNTAILNYTMLRGTMLAIAPKEYSVVSRQPVFFVAQNSDPGSGERRYRFQLDTSARFNSAARRDTVLFGYVTPQWTTNLFSSLASHDSTVYYWRVRYADLTAQDDSTWAESSFVYINNSPSGWSQSRPPQFRRNTVNRVSLDQNRGRWNFDNPVLNINVRAVGGSNPNWNRYQLVINGNTIATASACATDQPSPYCDRRSTNDRLLLLFIDGQTGRSYKFEDAHPAVCGADLMVMAIDQCWPQRTGVVTGMIDRMKPGDYVIIMNSRNASTLWQNATLPLTSIGVNAQDFLARTPGGSPFIIIGQKGALPGTAQVRTANPAVGDVTVQEITLAHTINIPPATNGTVTSTLIGPAAEWGNIFRLINGLEQPVRESWQLDVFGIDLQGREQLVRNRVVGDGTSLRDLSAKDFPYLRLRLTTRDSLNRTPAQLQRWQVIYREVPEGILLHDTVSYRENTTLEVVEGDSVRIGFNFLNISGNDFQDSLTVQSTITNAQTGRVTTLREKIPALRRNSFARIRIRLFSPDFRGDNRLSVTVNPRLLPEQIYENNTLQARFRVKPDDINPILDVTVDGRPIMDGDIIAPAPVIQISLRDENRYRPKRDTANFEILLARQCPNCQPRRIYMNDPNLTWNVSADNRFTVEYRSITLQNGTYVLSVQAADATGNRSGIQPYRISFRVINETTVTNFYPYPNPFSTSVRFVFTLTGDVPDNLRIQIMTVTGKVVRTIFKDELGPLRVGNNISEFAWNGTDEFGQELARGVYLYKVDVIDRSGENFQSRETGGDNLFKNGYGKLYLMR